MECPICHKAILPRSENPHWPFCSDRCRLIDLGRWLGEEYVIHDEQDDVSSSDGGGETLP